MGYKTLLKVFRVSIVTMVGLLVLQKALLGGSFYTLGQMQVLLGGSVLLLLGFSISAFLSGIGISVYWVRHEVKTYHRRHAH